MTFPQNTWGAENRLLYEFGMEKYHVVNPCLELKTFHVHDSNWRPNQHQSKVNTDGHNLVCCPSAGFFENPDKTDCTSCSCQNCGYDDGRSFHEELSAFNKPGEFPSFLSSRSIPEDWEFSMT